MTINKAYLDRSLLIKNLILKKLLRSIVFNENLNTKFKLISLLKLQSGNFSSTKVKRVCYISGKEKSVNPKLMVNRCVLNRLLIAGKLNNYSVNSW